ncbi:putative NAD/NADP transhydrogenase beta subunit [Magnetospirillum sp. SS-4]|nr:putative NAD/NADP transhydrogenase beta subunit [Magnetospirillum sp. SS-4]
MERHPRPAYPADERHQRHLQHHRHRRPGPDLAALGRGRLAPQHLDRIPGGDRHHPHLHQHVRRIRRHPPHAGDVPQVRRHHVRKSRHRMLYRCHHLVHPQPGRPVQPRDLAPGQLFRHGRHGARRRRHRVRTTSHLGRGSLDHHRHDHRRQRRSLRRPQGADDPDARTGGADALAGRPGRLPGRLRQLCRHLDHLYRRGKDHPRGRDLYRHPDRRHHLLRLADRLRQAVRQDRRQAAAAAGAALDEPGGPARRDLGRQHLRQRRIRRRRRLRPDRHDHHRAGVRRPHGDGHRRRRHAGGGLHAEQLFRLGGRRHRLHAVQRPPDRHRRAGGVKRRHPLLHHVPGDEPQLHQRHRRRLRYRRRHGGGGGRRPAGRRGHPDQRPGNRRPSEGSQERRHRAGLRHGGGAGPAHRLRDHQAPAGKGRQHPLRHPSGGGAHARPHERAAGRGQGALRHRDGNGRGQRRFPRNRRLDGDRRQRHRQSGGAGGPQQPHRRHAGAGGVEGQDLHRHEAVDGVGLRRRRQSAVLQGQQPHAVRRRQEDAGRGADRAEELTAVIGATTQGRRVSREARRFAVGRRRGDTKNPLDANRERA